MKKYTVLVLLIILFFSCLLDTKEIGNASINFYNYSPDDLSFTITLLTSDAETDDGFGNHSVGANNNLYFIISWESEGIDDDDDGIMDFASSVYVRLTCSNGESEFFYLYDGDDYIITWNYENSNELEVW